MKLFPVPKEAPPVEAAYQLIVPVLVAFKVTVPELQTKEGVVLAIVGIEFIVAVAGVLEALVHPFCDTSA